MRSPGWQNRTACLGASPSLFDLDGVGHGRTKAQVWEITEPARELCSRCPVQADCLAFMLPVGRRPTALSMVVAGRVFLDGVEIDASNARPVPTGVRHVPGKPYPWRAEISVGGRQVSLGSYKNRADAVRARREGERRYRGEAA